MIQSKTENTLVTIKSLQIHNRKIIKLFHIQLKLIMKHILIQHNHFPLVTYSNKIQII
jgi:hypothetical protein